MPNEPEVRRFKEKGTNQKLPGCMKPETSFGLTWGHLTRFRPFPKLSLELYSLETTHRASQKFFQDCNYLQGIEGAVDISHRSTFLHLGFGRTGVTDWGLSGIH